MKLKKKIVSVLLAAVMVLAMCVPAMAYTITGPENDHTYEVYQIFKGTLTGNVLSDIKWGKNAKGQTEGDVVPDSVLKELENLNGKNDTDKLNAIAKYADLDALKKFGEVSKTAALNNVPAGYYLIKDKNGSFTGKDDAYTKYIVKIVNDVTIVPKSEKPSVEKKVQENVKSDNTTGGYGDKYNDTADYNIGDDVPFRLYGKVIDMSEYKTYKYIFHDTCADSLDINDNVAVYYSADKAGTSKVAIDSGLYKVDRTNHTLTVSFDDLKQVKNNSAVISTGYIIVEYTAKLNSDAAIGQGTVGSSGNGNVNEVYLEYSNNPNQGGEGETGKTPKDKVIVFTYELDVTKVDGADPNTKLENAEFVLYRGSGENIEYAKVDTTNSKVTGWTTNKNEASVLKSDSNGLFSVIGLDDGIYYLEETKAPSGYNTLPEPVKVEIKADTSNGQNGDGQVTELKKIEVKVKDGAKTSGNAVNGTVGVTVENNSGSTLPETGGIGTTIFYVVGVILMLGAGVLLVTKKRMSSNR